MFGSVTCKNFTQNCNDHRQKDPLGVIYPFNCARIFPRPCLESRRGARPDGPADSIRGSDSSQARSLQTVTCLLYHPAQYQY